MGGLLSLSFCFRSRLKNRSVECYMIGSVLSNFFTMLPVSIQKMLKVEIPTYHLSFGEYF